MSTRLHYYCDVCGREILQGERSFVHYAYAYCEECEKIHERNDREYRETHRETTIGWGI